MNRQDRKNLVQLVTKYTVHAALYEKLASKEVGGSPESCTYHAKAITYNEAALELTQHTGISPLRTCYNCGKTPHAAITHGSDRCLYHWGFKQ